MIIIASAAYVDMEFRAEVGDLPPAMLPVGNKRLFEHQVDVLRDKFLDENIYLSLPEGYKLPKKDHLKILEYNIEVVVVPVDTSLADSILYVINSVGEYEGGVRLLHGDTLIYDLPSGIDVIAVSKTSDDYNWEIESIGLNEETVWSGFFSFRTPKLLIKSLTVSRGSFVDAIRLYNVHSQMDVIELFEWLDFGHINNYFKSRSKINTQRHFNEIKIDDGKVIKSSNNSVKISAERKWFRSVPPEIRYYTPQVIGQGNLISGDEYYEVEYLSCMPLNEIFVHTLNPIFFWVKIFKHLMRFLNDCIEAAADIIIRDQAVQLKVRANLLIFEKTKKRVSEYIERSAADFNMTTKLNGNELPSLNYIIDDCLSKSNKLSYVFGVSHGDLCFSNILYDTRSDRIKVIDPRGIDAKGDFSCLGDLRYDLSKINHSVIGLYDHIVAGAYDLSENNELDFNFEIFVDDRLIEIQKIYLENMKLTHLSPIDLMPETILLFFSMLPLHSDAPERQQAFMQMRYVYIRNI